MSIFDELMLYCHSERSEEPRSIIGGDPSSSFVVLRMTAVPFDIDCHGSPVDGESRNDGKV